MRWLNSILALAILLTLVACWTGWSAAFMRVRIGKSILPAEPRRNVPWGGFDLVICILMMLGFPLLAVLGMQATTDLLPSLKKEEITATGHSALLLANSLASLVALVFAVLLVKFGARATWSDLGVSRRHALVDLLLGVVAFFMLAPVVYVVMLVLVQWFPSEHPIVRLVKEDPRLYSLSLFSAVGVAPIVEEFMFRVLLQGWLEKTDPIRFLRSLGKPHSETAGKPASDEVPPVVAPPDKAHPADLSLPARRLTTTQAANPYAPPSPESYGAVIAAEVAEPEEEPAR